MAALDPIAKDAWNRNSARHLLNRAGFGVSHARIDDLAKMTPEEAVDFFIDFDKVKDNLREPDWLLGVRNAREIKRMVREMNVNERSEFRNKLLEDEIKAVELMKAWWLTAMKDTTRPLQEKLALFWHGHFAVSAGKVESPGMNYELNKIFRVNAAGNFKTLTTAVGQSAAMLWYLDNNLNVKAHPNENWARELMELFTMSIGNYTEKDIQESARAFSGWTFDESGNFIFKREDHDDGEKTFLGRTGKFEGKDVIDVIFSQPCVAEYISRKLWEFFAYEKPEPEVAQKLAAIFRDSGYEMKPLLRAMFLSNEFYSPRAVMTQIKSPSQLIVGLLDGLSIAPEEWNQIHRLTKALGQELFFPPSVKGWDGGRAWINTHTLLLRYNVSAFFLYGNSVLRDRSRTDPLFDAAGYFKPLDGKKNSDVVAALIDRFLGAAVTEKQTALLREIMGDPDGAFTLAQERIDKATAALHMILSAVEFQLC